MKTLFSAALLFAQLVVYGQSSFCGTSVADQHLQLELLKQHAGAYRQDNSTVYIPLLVHNVSNDNSLGFYAPWALFETLCTLNRDFEPSGIQFFLESDFNYIRNSSWNEHEEFEKGIEMMQKSNVRKVVNCYLVSNPAGNCGYFAYQGDAVALNKSCLGSRSHTWAHELGHYFSLPHTFYGWEGITYSTSKKTLDYQSQVFTAIENVDRDLCQGQADQFCDTWPDYISRRWTCAPDGMSGGYMRDTRDSLFRADGTLFMSYSDDACMNRFSDDQMSAMHQNINGPRASLKRTNVVPKWIDPSGVELLLPEQEQEVPNAGVVLSWEAVENARYYVLQISRTVNFSVVIKNLLLTEPMVELDSLVADKNYWWRVRAFSEFDFCGAESIVGKFKTAALVTATSASGKEELKLIPNPAKSMRPIQISGDWTKGEPIAMYIYDANGLEVAKPEWQWLGKSLLVDTDYMADGIYFLQVLTDKDRFIQKLIIKNN